jgi:hypothetical protein
VSGPPAGLRWISACPKDYLAAVERDSLCLHKHWWNHQSDWLWSRTSQKAVSVIDSRLHLTHFLIVGAGPDDPGRRTIGVPGNNIAPLLGIAWIVSVMLVVCGKAAGPKNQ